MNIAFFKCLNINDLNNIIQINNNYTINDNILIIFWWVEYIGTVYTPQNKIQIFEQFVLFRVYTVHTVTYPSRIKIYLNP